MLVHICHWPAFSLVITSPLLTGLNARGVSLVSSCLGTGQFITMGTACFFPRLVGTACFPAYSAMHFLVSPGNGMHFVLSGVATCVWYCFVLDDVVLFEY